MVLWEIPTGRRIRHSKGPGGPGSPGNWSQPRCPQQQEPARAA